MTEQRINRIRLEFKVAKMQSLSGDWWAGINRIRLEFKGQFNLKGLHDKIGINRIRLEFKENMVPAVI